MTDNKSIAIEAIAKSLQNLPQVAGKTSFACRLTVPAQSLSLEVNGVGKIRHPVSANRVKALIKVARKAPFGRKHKTLTDSAVRDAWEIAKSRIMIDQRAWSQVLNPALQQISEQLGLDEGELKADLYKMLIYQPGQFFVPHRDSEKDDNMIATLVVVLPSAHSGGALVIDHQDSIKRFHSHRLPPDKLGLFAFYADCRHELKPVTEGNRIVLTYNLSYKGAARKPRLKPQRQAISPATDPLQSGLRNYFSNTQQSSPLVVLLDHQYSKRSLRWSNLKNLDRSRATALETALDAEYGRDGYHLNLALLALHETWHATDERYSDDYRYRYDHDDWDDDEDWDDDDDQDDEEVSEEESHQNLTLHELIEQYATLADWRDRENNSLRFDSLSMYDVPVAACTPIHRLKPASSYYEDYTGNAGNTLDRTYHRAAIVIWTDQMHSGVLADISLGQLFGYWLQTLDGKPAAEYVAALTSLDLPKRLLRYDRDPDTLATMIELLKRCEQRKLAIKYLQPFSLHALTARRFPEITKLASPYGAGFLEEIFSEWTDDNQSRWRWFEWVHTLQSFISYCRKNSDPALEHAPTMLFDRFYKKCQLLVSERQRSSIRCNEALSLDKNSGAELAAVCSAAMSLGDEDRIQRLAQFVLENANLYESAGLVLVLKKVDAKLAPSLHQELFTLLEARLQKEADSHIHDKDDWRIAHTINCRCELCAQLKAFLDHSGHRALDIPAAKNKRMHLHRKIDSQKLPVSHTTTRIGRPFTLNLVKKKSLFSREKKLRQSKLDLLKQVRLAK